MTGRESDHLIVLGGRESRPQGKGGDGGTEPSQETCAGQCRAGARKPTSLKGIAYPGQPGLRKRVSLRSPVREWRRRDGVGGRLG